MAMRNQRKVKMTLKRLPNQQDSYERLTPKPTGPGIVSVPIPRQVDKGEGRMHADGKNHKNPKAIKPRSTIANEPDEGQKKVPSRVKMAPGVPNDMNIKRGYFPPDADISKKNVGNETYT